MKKFKYRVFPILIKPEEDVASKLTEILNIESNCGWQLVQWNLISSSMLMTLETTPCYGTTMILATLKKEV